MIEFFLRRAVKIRVFPQNAVMDRKMFSVERTINSSLTLVSSTEQYNSVIAISSVGPVIFLFNIEYVQVITSLVTIIMVFYTEDIVF